MAKSVNSVKVISGGACVGLGLEGGKAGVGSARERCKGGGGGGGYTCGENIVPG